MKKLLVLIVLFVISSAYAENIKPIKKSVTKNYSPHPALSTLSTKSCEVCHAGSHDESIPKIKWIRKSGKDINK